MDATPIPYLRHISANYHSGFTMIELVITLIISTILLGMAFPSLSTLVADSRLSHTINGLIGDLHYARSEAVKRGQWVTVCKSDVSSRCNKEAQWHDGWLIFVDLNRDRQRTVQEPLLRIQPSLKPELTINLGSFYSSNIIVYYPTGRSPSNGTFTFCDDRGESHAKAMVFFKGRTRTISTMPDGSPLTCP